MTEWIISVPLILAVAVVLIAVAVDGWLRPRNPAEITFAAAKDALELVRQWTMWMAGIQTAVLGGLAYLVKDLHLEQTQSFWASATTTCLGAALFASAWILSALPIARINMVETEDRLNDFYEQSMYSFLPIRMGLVLFLQHTFWILGLMSLGFFCYYVFL